MPSLQIDDLVLSYQGRFDFAQGILLPSTTMSVDESFIAAIQANPTDDALRLVYADWLEEQGDPRGEYLRLVHQLEREKQAQKYEELRKRLLELAPTLDETWRHAVGKRFDVVMLSCERDCFVRAARAVSYVGGVPGYLAARVVYNSLPGIITRRVLREDAEDAQVILTSGVLPEDYVPPPPGYVAVVVIVATREER